MSHHDHDHADDCGFCKGCQWWEAEHDGPAADAAVGLCMHPDLTHFSLQVTGHSGCNRYHALAADAGRTSLAVAGG